MVAAQDAVEGEGEDGDGVAGAEQLHPEIVSEMQRVQEL